MFGYSNFKIDCIKVNELFCASLQGNTVSDNLCWKRQSELCVGRCVCSALQFPVEHRGLYSSVWLLYCGHSSQNSGLGPETYYQTSSEGSIFVSQRFMCGQGNANNSVCFVWSAVCVSMCFVASGHKNTQKSHRDQLTRCLLIIMTSTFGLFDTLCHVWTIALALGINSAGCRI